LGALKKYGVFGGKINDFTHRPIPLLYVCFSYAPEGIMTEILGGILK
jgi:hypothetical protein